LSQVEIPSHRYAVFSHRSHVSTIRYTIEAIGKDWLPNSGYKAAGDPDFFERYKSFDPETGIGDIEIWLPIE
jgi:AraC family transcriptional regulator